MKPQEKHAIKEQLSPLLDTYAPIFEAHGIKCSLHFRQVDQPELDARSSRRRLFDDIVKWLKKLFTGKVPEESGKIRTWCVILRFSPSDKPYKKDVYKEYCFVFRYRDKYGIHIINNVSRAIKRELEEKRKLLGKQDAESLYTDSWWDVLRYVCGSYWYKDSAKGIDLNYLRIGMLLLCATLGLIGLFLH